MLKKTIRVKREGTKGKAEEEARENGKGEGTDKPMT
jgi:hypothetical protein